MHYTLHVLFDNRPFVVATDDDAFEIYVDISYQAYMRDWLAEAGAIASACHT